MDPTFLSAPGDVAALMRRHDWSGSPLGAPAGWPRALQTLVQLLLRSRTATYVAWGPQRAMLYNDAYVAILGDKHPAALGRPFLQVWPDLWPTIGERFERCFAGEPVLFENAGATIVRSGRPERATFTVSYTPVIDDGEVAGLFCTILETTEQVQSERKLRVATEGEGVGTWELDLVSGRGRWSANAAAMMGLGRSDFSADDWIEGVVPDDRPMVARAWQATVHEQQPYEVEFRTLAGRWALSRGQFERDERGRPVRGAGVMFDVTARALAEAGLRESQRATQAAQERLQLAMAIADAGTWDYDMASGALHWSPSHFSLLGYEPAPDGLARMDMWQDAVHPDDAQRLQAELDRARQAHDVFRSEHRLRRADGRYLWVSAAGRYFFDEAGEAVRFVGIFFDITQRRLAEQALRTADRRKDEFLATLAHELRNPMAPVRNGLAVLRTPGVEPALRQRMLDLMERQVQHMVRLVDDLLEVSRITRGKIDLRLEDVELGALLRGCLEGAQPQFDAAHQHVTVTLPAQPVLVRADATRIAQVVDNLLSNAAKYSGEGGNVQVQLAAEGAQAVLTVQDDGTGIPPDMLERVFELFTQVDRTLGRARGGLGIGLALVRQLVQMHGGTVHAHSRGIGTGARFTVRLPLLQQEARPEPAPASAAHVAAQVRPQRVLVVDDNQDAADSLGLVLQSAGHHVRTAYSGEQALAIAADWQPQWVLLDIGMPGMDGHAVARALRQRPDGAALHLVAVTGWGQQDDRRSTQASGFDHHLVKPVEPATLLALLQTGA